MLTRSSSKAVERKQVRESVPAKPRAQNRRFKVRDFVARKSEKARKSKSQKVGPRRRPDRKHARTPTPTSENESDVEENSEDSNVETGNRRRPKRKRARTPTPTPESESDDEESSENSSNVETGNRGKAKRKRAIRTPTPTYESGSDVEDTWEDSYNVETGTESSGSAEVQNAVRALHSWEGINDDTVIGQYLGRVVNMGNQILKNPLRK